MTNHPREFTKFRTALNRYDMKKLIAGFRAFFTSSFILLITALSMNCVGQQSTKLSLLALSKSDHTLAIVDPVSLKVQAKIPVGQDPHEVIASPDGKKAYVTIYGGGAFHELNVIDLVEQKALPNVDTRPLYGPHDLAFANGKLWFTAEGSKAVGRFDPATSKLDFSIGTGQDRTHMIHVTGDAKNIYTTNMSSGTVSILTDSLLQVPNARPRQEWVQTVLPASRGVEGFDVTADGRELWAAASEDGTITIINLRTKQVDAKLDAKVNGANRLKFTMDGKLAFISSLSTGDLHIFDTSTRTLLKKLKVGNGAAGILMDPDGSRVFVACSPDNYIAIVDIKELKVTGHLEVGKNPDGMAWAVKQ
jgi:DNA-binding beta-propeller fold protein YncE